ncbi:hypothetical protein BB14905_09800 [Bacillus sp. B14905]|nr:hypothetical protein BB14905_09800 [Bacillus sp. B14905]
MVVHKNGYSLFFVSISKEWIREQNDINNNESNNFPNHFLTLFAVYSLKYVVPLYFVRTTKDYSLNKIIFHQYDTIILYKKQK